MNTNTKVLERVAQTLLRECPLYVCGSSLERRALLEDCVQLTEAGETTLGDYIEATKKKASVASHLHQRWVKRKSGFHPRIEMFAICNEMPAPIRIQP